MTAPGEPSRLERWLDFGTRTRFEDLPGRVVERTRLALLDTLAALMAGHRGESVPEHAADGASRNP